MRIRIHSPVENIGSCRPILLKVSQIFFQISMKNNSGQEKKVHNTLFFVVYFGSG